jgi:hypothetical protein
MWVHLTSEVTGKNINLSLVDETDDLDVVRSLHELKASESAGWDETGALARLGTPSNHLSFVAANIHAGFRGTPETEVIKGVDEGSLAF